MSTARARYVEAPTTYTPRPGDPPAVFLAGGITGVPDWQAAAVQVLGREPCVVLNPRRRDFPIGDPAAAPEQIAWECEHRKLSPLVMMFWFPACDPTATVQPIALLELGAELARCPSRQRGLVVGADSGYPRYLDVQLQCRYDRPDVTVHTTLDATLVAARAAVRGLHRNAAGRPAATAISARPGPQPPQ